MSVVAFQTRARTIDHLGRGQIADCPTAVSELWKNAYDAYAKKVALHVFDGKTPIAAITDNGHGMDYEEFLTKWLIVGTDAKVSDSTTPKEDRHGLPLRERQGEKGIGRLSIAFLGPIVFVITKRSNKPFVCALVDWRMFENPFLLMGDIRLPVQHFERKEDLAGILPAMFEQLGENVTSTELNSEEKSEQEEDRHTRIRTSWEKYSGIQKKNKLPDTATAVRTTAASGIEFAEAISTRCLEQWDVWAEKSSHGTALFVLNINHELAVWVDPDVPDGDPEAGAIKKSLKETLIGFVDPYVNHSIEFNYAVTIHQGEKQTNIVSSDNVFSWGELRALEHIVEGEVDENGTFRGRVKAFGMDIGEVIFPSPDRPGPIKARAVVGPFSLCIGSYESDPSKTSMSPEQHRHVEAMAEMYAGLAIYRDQLRVMPYGRAQADYFGIEERRSFHAGRWFWSYRRTFGRVAITRASNANLKDKAGREGFIDNQARREFRNLVVEILKTTAQRFFGTDAQVRKDYLPDIVTANKAAKDAEVSTQDHRKIEFRRALRQKAPELKTAMGIANTAKEDFRKIVGAGDLEALVKFETTVNELEARKTEMKLPAKPAKLESLEDDYRTYRDQYAGYCTTTDDIRNEWAETVEKIKKKPAVEEGRTLAATHIEQLDNALLKWQRSILAILDSERARIVADIERDEARYTTQSEPLVADLSAGRTKLPDLVRQLEAIRETLHLEFAQRYGGYVRVLENLAQGVDIDALTAWSIEQRQEMQGRVDQLNALAQLGVTVELVGHEIETHYEEINRYLNSLPNSAQHSKPWRDLRDAIKALFDRLRFVTPLQLSGKRFQRDITGEEVTAYISQFFEARFQRARIDFRATEAFRAVKFREYPARVYPVFINLINNSLYWVSLGTRREILIDVVGDDIVEADTGRGVDPEDVASLFQLFFTKRTEGRGVGLYLCRANLAAGGHTIEYATDKAHQLLPGANFVIKLRGLEHG
ncbi:MAG: ATP-binding protein [Planctomycetota bacterium]